MEKIAFGEVFSGTIETLQAHSRAVIQFIGAMTVIGTLLEWGIGLLAINAEIFSGMSNSVLTMLGLGAGLGGLAVIVVLIVLTYKLWGAMLADSDLLTDKLGYAKLLPYVGLSILTALGTTLGFLLLIVPGLLCMARWSAAPAFLLRQDAGVIDSMGKSWDMIKGNSTPIILATFVAGLGVAVLSGMLAGFDAVSPAGTIGATSFISSLLGQLMSNTVSALQVGLGVFLFRRLSGDTDDVGAVFD